MYIPYGMKILHGIKFYGFTVGYTTVKLKSVNFSSINIAMSLLKIQRGTWPTDLIKATVYESEIFSLLPSRAQLVIHNWRPNEYTHYSFPVQIII